MSEETSIEQPESKSAKPEWIKMKPAEVEKIVLDLAKKGESPAKIGLKLRDEHGIPKIKLISKKISKIIRENDMKAKSDKERIDAKMKNLESHMEKNKKDMSAKKAHAKGLWIVNKVNKLN